MHPDVAALCLRAAAAAGLDICGIDLRLPTSRRRWPGRTRRRDGRAVLELNACPGLRMHLAPVRGPPARRGRGHRRQLYPPGTQARIPVVAVTGTNGKTTTVA